MFKYLFNSARKYRDEKICKEFAVFARFFDQLIQYKPLAHDSSDFLNHVDHPSKRISTTLEKNYSEQEARLIVLNCNLNHDEDIQKTFLEIHESLTRSDRLVCLIYNSYWKWFYVLLHKLKLKTSPIPTTFITRDHLRNIAKISNYEMIDCRPFFFFPFSCLKIGNFINYIIPVIPYFRWLSLLSFVTLRPLNKESTLKSLSIVIPARNERGNIERAVKELAYLKMPYEIIFVEGGSSDGTWEEILRVKKDWENRTQIQAMQQDGKGKNNAVIKGFLNARYDLLTILDADLTMPPNLLDRFYLAYQNGHGDFINGSRMVYSKEDGSMQTLNIFGNIFFSKLLSYILDIHITDSLCGTKLLPKYKYLKLREWIKVFGDFDPFGDFELLFFASLGKLGIAEIPIKYKSREYGETNISRFSHGWMLLKMSSIALFRIKTGR